MAYWAWAPTIVNWPASSTSVEAHSTSNGRLVRTASHVWRSVRGCTSTGTSSRQVR